MFRGVLLNVLHAHEPGSHKAENGSEQGAFGTDGMRQSFGFLQNVSDCREAFVTVRLQQFRLGLTFHDHGQLPAEIDHVLHTRIHSLRSRRTMNVGRVSTQKNSPNLKPIHHPAVDAKPRTPAHVTKSRRNV
jgi:hypothetical protein